MQKINDDLNALYGTVTPANLDVSQISRNSAQPTANRQLMPICMRNIWRIFSLSFSTSSPPRMVPPAPAGSSTTPTTRISKLYVMQTKFRGFCWTIWSSTVFQHSILQREVKDCETFIFKL